MTAIKNILNQESKLTEFHKHIKLEGIRIRIESERVKAMWLEEPNLYERFIDLAEKALLETTDPKLQAEIRESVERVKKSREKLMEGWKDMFS